MACYQDGILINKPTNTFGKGTTFACGKVSICVVSEPIHSNQNGTGQACENETYWYTGFGSWKNMNWKIPYKTQKFLEKYIMRDFVKLLARLYAK